MRTRLRIPARAFTIIELLVVIAIISFLAALLLTALAGAKNKAKDTQCLNDAKQIGPGLRMYANDNDGKFPWAVPVVEGGSMVSAGTHNGYLAATGGFVPAGAGPAYADWVDHFRAASNELVTPKILACPRDNSKIPANDWSIMSGGENVSYFAGLTADESKPQTLLSGDGNIIGGGGGLEPYWNTFAGSSINATYEDTIHRGKGILLLSDGSANMTTTAQLRDQISVVLASGSTNVTISKPQGFN